YRGQRSAFEREFARRLSQLAELAASQVSPADLTDARQLGTDGNGLLALQLDALCSATGLSNVSVIDDSARVVYDVRAGFATAGSPSPYDSLSHATLVQARGARSVAFPPFRHGEVEARAAAARIGDSPGAVLVTEDQPTWEPELARLRRDLSLLAAVSVLAVAALALLVLRANTSQVSLERRLSRAQNLAAMGRMTATLAHEIKNPLAIIRGSARRRGHRGGRARRRGGDAGGHARPARGGVPRAEGRGRARAGVRGGDGAIGRRLTQAGVAEPAPERARGLARWRTHPRRDRGRGRPRPGDDRRRRRGDPARRARPRRRAVLHHARAGHRARAPP